MLKLLSLFLLLSFSVSSFAESALKNHPSPYVRLHANDAVNWQVWDKSVMQRAKKENKLVLISIGYFACHWCHVMREESFSNKDIGQYLNDHYMAVKVDRELNPALDDYLMSFLNSTNGYGGWPLNVFVTPDGYPLVGMVYKPPAEFKDFLVQVNDRWQTENEELNDLAREAFEYAQRNSKNHSEAVPAAELKNAFLGQLYRAADDMMGGLGNQAKFPREPMMLALLDFYAQKKDEKLKTFLVLTLDQIMKVGMHDVIGGGFFRYTVDPNWTVPHFEKMLYNNAALIQVYLKAFELFKDKRYLQIAVETTEFILRDMKLNDRGFASSINSQDDHGVEGGGYVWSKQTLKKLLTAEELRKVEKHWAYVSMEGTSDVFPVGLALGKDWQSIKKKLKAGRKQKTHPVDEKVLPSWNGFTLSALSQIVKATGRKDFKQAGQHLYEELQRQAEKGLLRSGTGEQKYLEDYAFVAQGLFDWRRNVLHQPADAMTKNLLRDGVKLFSSKHGWRLSDTQILPMPGDKVNLADAQLPAGDAVILNLLHKIHGAKGAKSILKAVNPQNWLDMRLVSSPIDFATQVQYQLMLTQ